MTTLEFRSVTRGSWGEGIYTSLKPAELQECRFETVVVEIPVVNKLANLAAHRDLWRKFYAEADVRMAYAQGSSCFQRFLRCPTGLGTLALMCEELTLADREKPNSLVQPADGCFMRLDERFLNDETLFSNLTHLGLNGNRKFGVWLAAELVRPSGEVLIADRSLPAQEFR